MSKQDVREWPPGFVATSLLTLVLLATAFSACGQSGEGSSKAPNAQGQCAVGRPPTLKHQYVPDWALRENQGTAPVIVDCFKDAVGGPAEMVGYGSIGPSVCVIVEDIRLDEAHGHFCSLTEGEETEVCAPAPSCLTAFIYTDGMTEFSGPLRANVDQIRVSVGGRPARGSWSVAHVDAGLGKRIQASDPFGFFAAFLRGCIPAKKVEVVLLDAQGDRLGWARRWDAPVNSCS
jgi:hypothetical protein